jgi:hypothetical protein
MSNFKQGDKLVCVKAGEPSLGLIKNKVYTCFNTFTNPYGESVVEVLESMPPQIYHGYLSMRFRKALPADLEKIKEFETIEG